jgi:kinesin family protein 5
LLPVEKDAFIVQMKRNMVEAHIINQHLMRTIAALEWKQVIEYGKAKLKSVLIENQEKTISRL